VGVYSRAAAEVKKKSRQSLRSDGHDSSSDAAPSGRRGR